MSSTNQEPTCWEEYISLPQLSSSFPALEVCENMTAINTTVFIRTARNKVKWNSKKQWENKLWIKIVVSQTFSLRTLALQNINVL